MCIRWPCAIVPTQPCGKGSCSQTWYSPPLTWATKRVASAQVLLVLCGGLHTSRASPTLLVGNHRRSWSYGASIWLPMLQYPRHCRSVLLYGELSACGELFLVWFQTPVHVSRRAGFGPKCRVHLGSLLPASCISASAMSPAPSNIRLISVAARFERRAMKSFPEKRFVTSGGL